MMTCGNRRATQGENFRRDGSYVRVRRFSGYSDGLFMGPWVRRPYDGLKGGGDTGGHAHPAAAGKRGARHLLPDYGRLVASVAAFVLAGGGLRGVRDHHRRRLPIRGCADHRPAPGAGMPIAFLVLHRPLRLHLSERIYRAARLARNVRGDMRGDPRDPLRTAGRP